MRAVVFRGRQTVRVEEVPDPRIEAPGNAVVRVRLAAICGSDLHPYHERERGLDAGTVMGHEFVGEVVATSEGGPPIGLRVLSPFSTSCGRCFYCTRGLTARCSSGQLYGWVQGGVGLEGAQAEYVRVPLAATTLVPVPEDLSDEQALLLGDVLSTGHFCARMAEVSPHGTYAVVGCGPVGLMAVAAAVDLGAERVFAVDSIPERLALAVRLGARAIDLAREDPVERLRESTEGRGPDAVLEAVGSPAAGRLAYELVRTGGTIAAAGVHTEPALAFTPAEAYDKNLTYRTGRCPSRALLEELIPLVRRRPELTSVISHRLPLERAVEGYELFDRKLDGCTKVALRPGTDGSAA